MSRNVKDRPGVRPLRELCQRALMANIGRLRHLGWVPQYLVADALSQCTAEQLEAIEQHNPHIIADNEPLWMAHCAAKYKELRELQLAISSGAAPPVPSWRTAYWDMRRQDEIRAQQIMERVRTRTAEIERERDARKVRVLPVSEARTRLRGAAARPGAAAKGSTLVQHARIMTKAHMQMFQPAQSPGRAQSPPPQPAMHRKHMSPSGSPAQSPPYNSSPPYYSSSASSCSPPYVPHAAYSPPYMPHSAYSPPYVPNSGPVADARGLAGFDIFEDIMGVSASAARSSTAVITVQPSPRHSSAAKRKRRESHVADAPAASSTSASASAAERQVKVRSEDLTDPGAKDFFRMLAE